MGCGGFVTGEHNLRWRNGVIKMLTLPGNLADLNPKQMTHSLHSGLHMKKTIMIHFKCQSHSQVIEYIEKPQKNFSRH